MCRNSALVDCRCINYIAFIIQPGDGVLLGNFLYKSNICNLSKIGNATCVDFRFTFLDDCTVNQGYVSLVVESFHTGGVSKVDAYASGRTRIVMPITYTHGIVDITGIGKRCFCNNSASRNLDICTS